MALSIKHPQADELARELSELTGETLTDTVLNSLRDRLRLLKVRAATPRLIDELELIARRCAALPVLDPRSDDEILGYFVSAEHPG